MGKLKIRTELAFPFLLILISLGEVLLSLTLPGLQMDAVSPDYYAVQFLNPNSYTVSWLIPHLGYPFLFMIYCGTPTMLMNILSILFTGTTSLLQLRLLNALYGATACILIWKILKKAGTPNWISALIPLLLVLSPVLTSLYRTQYHVVLPGVIFFLAAILCLMNWHEHEKNITLLLGGFFAGLAGYDYFTFLFCLPGFLLAAAFIGRRHRITVRKSLLVMISGIALGLLPYLVGFLGLILYYLDTLSQIAKILITIGFAVIYTLALVFFYHIQKRDRLSAKDRVLTLLLLAIGVAVVCVIVLFTVHYASDILEGLNVAGSPANLSERIQKIISFTELATRHSAIEYLVMTNHPVQTGLWFVPSLWLVSMAVFAVVWFIRRKKTSITSPAPAIIGGLLAGAMIYFLLCIPFATRMQPQHFVIMMFVMYLSLGLALGYILTALRPAQEHMTSIPSKDRVAPILTAACLLACLLVNGHAHASIGLKLMDERNIDNEVFSQATGDLAALAIDHLNQGEQEYYVFPEWGVAFGFDYLTGNNIGFSTVFYEEIIRDLSMKGYTIITAYWNAENTQTYIDELIGILGNDTMVRSDVLQSWGADLLLLTVVPE